LAKLLIRPKAVIEEYYFCPLAGAMITIAVVMGTLIFTYAQADILLATKALGMIMFMIVGIVLHMVFMGGINIHFTLPLKKLYSLIMYISIGLILVFATQYIVVKSSPLIFTATEMFVKMFYMIAGVAEEFFFRFYLFTVMITKIKFFPGQSEFILVAVVNSLLFMIYHFYIYGTDPNLLLLVFMSSVILCIIYYLSKAISVPVIAHATVNFMAGG